MQNKNTTEETYLSDIDYTKSKAYIIVWILLICAFLGLIIGSYFFYPPKKHYREKEQVHFSYMKPTDNPENIYSYIPSHNTESLPAVDSNSVITSNENPISQPQTKQKNMQQPVRMEKPSFQKPKVVIIIDDLANPKDIKKFQSLGLKLNLSLFPRQFFSQQNPKIAKTLDFYMIHLPLEAQNFKQRGVKVLRVGDSLQTIDSYIAVIKKDFPQLQYLNNHTGSLYTESKDDMEKFLNVLKKYHITFVDSRTTARSVAKDLFQQNNTTPYLARNIFLDNQNNVTYISKQLKKALKLANTKGYVIAIGHPKKATYEVLKSYKNQLLKDYTLLYMNELEKILQENGIQDSDTPLPLKKDDKNHKTKT